MDTKLDASLPAELSPAHWSKSNKEAAAALDTAGVLDALKALGKLYAGFDLALFSTAKLAKSADAQKRLDAAQAALAKQLRPLQDAARAAEAAARKALAGFKSAKTDAKKGPAAAQSIADAAGRFAVAIGVQVEAAVAALEDRLAELLAADEEEAQKKQAEAAKSGKGGEAALELSKPFLLVRKKAVEGLRAVKNTKPELLAEKPMRYLAACGAKRARVYIARAVSAAQQALLKGLLPGEAQVKFFKGEIVWEAKAYTFVGAPMPGAFARQMQRALLEQTKSKFRVRARKLDAGPGEPVDEADGDADPDHIDAESGEAVATGKAGAKQPAPRADVVVARFARIRAELDAVIARGGAHAASLAKARDAIPKLIKEGKLDPAQKLLAKVEDVVLMIGSADDGAGSGPTVSDGPPVIEPAGKGGKPPPPASDDTRAAEQLALVRDYLGAMTDAKLKAPIEQQRVKLQDGLTQARALPAGAKRDAALKTLAAAAKKLVDDTLKAADADAKLDQASKARAAANATLGKVTALVLGAISDAAARDKVNTELKKLQASLEKADALGNAAARLKAYQAVNTAAQALLQRAEGANTSEDFAQQQLEPLFATAAKAVTGLQLGRAREVLMGELESLRSDQDRYEKAADAFSLQSIVKPRLVKLARVATAIPKLAAALDRDLAEADKLIAALDAAGSAELRTRLAALKEQRANDFPAGATLDEIDAEDKLIGPAVKALIADAQTLARTLNARAEVAKLRKRVDALKARIDKASETGVPTFVEVRQKKVRDALAQFEKFEKADDIKSCEIAFSSLGAALDAMEQAKANAAATRKKFLAAREGGIKASKAAKLQPANLGTLRNTSLDKEGARIEKLIDDGLLAKAEKAIDEWLKQARTWAKSPAVYNNLRSGHPVKGAMKDLIDEPGGGEVFDALIADLPDATTTTETMTTAMEARFGMEVSQFNHRSPDKDKGRTYADKREKTKPKEPQKGLKDLYRILRMVPVKDVKTIERFEENMEQGGGALYSPGVFNDDIVMYAGRPSDAPNMALGDPASIVPPGMALDPRAVPPGGGAVAVQFYTHSALHEVGHGVDDDKGVMKKHMGEAGWETHSVGHVAEVVAKFYGYDEGYVKSLLTNKGKEPKDKPGRSKDVKTDKEWEDARKDVVRWAQQSVVDADPWGNPANAKANAIGGRVFHESYEGDWVSYHLAARALGVRDYQFRSHFEWFAELYAAFHLGKLNPSHPATPWLRQLKEEAGA